MLIFWLYYFVFLHQSVKLLILYICIKQYLYLLLPWYKLTKFWHTAHIFLSWFNVICAFTLCYNYTYFANIWNSLFMFSHICISFCVLVVLLICCGFKTVLLATMFLYTHCSETCNVIECSSFSGLNCWPKTHTFPYSLFLYPVRLSSICPLITLSESFTVHTAQSSRSILPLETQNCLSS